MTSRGSGEVAAWGARAFRQLAQSAQIWRWLAVAMCAVIPIAVYYAPAPNDRLRSSLAIHDFGHVVAFGAVTALLAVALNAWSRPTFGRRARAICLAVAAALALGAGVELAQAVSGLGGDPWDVLRDAGGALTVALILTALTPGTPRRLRAAFGGAAFLVLAPFVYPMLSALHDETRARAEFPILASFGTRSDLTRFNFQKGTQPIIVITKDEDGHTFFGLQLLLPPGKYPGFELRYFPGNWQGLRALKLLIINPEPMPSQISVRIDDVKYRRNLSDRYNRPFPLSPGVNRIEIPLSEVAAAARGRKFDLGRVYSLMVYGVDVKQPRTIIVGPIVLER